MKLKIEDIRKRYAREKLVESKAAGNPLKQFRRWWKDVLKAKIVEPNAMTLATASPDGFPSARVVLLKGLEKEGFIFYTNYDSFKGRQLAENPKAALVFFWKELERQVRITGLVQRLSAEANEKYFHSRPRESQLGAAVSPQSQVIESRELLLKQYSQMKKQLKGKPVDCPTHWGGYILHPVIVEFWQGRPGRLHDRLQYTLGEDGDWKIERLAP